MGIKELQQNLLASVGEKLVSFGFDKKAKGQSFYRAIEGGKVSVHLSFIKHVVDFDVTVDVAVRFDEVEDLVNFRTKSLIKKKNLNTSTLGVELGNLSNGEPKRWSIFSQDQISSVTDSILDTYEKIGEPYLSKYSSMEAAYELLSRDDKSAWIHCPFHATRAMNAIALAKLLKRPDIQNQISIRRQFLEDKKDFGLSDFLNFTNCLL